MHLEVTSFGHGQAPSSFSWTGPVKGRGDPSDLLGQLVRAGVRLPGAKASSGHL
jgi:hypothetical protein